MFPHAQKRSYFWGNLKACWKPLKTLTKKDGRVIRQKYVFQPCPVKVPLPLEVPVAAASPQAWPFPLVSVSSALPLAHNPVSDGSSGPGCPPDGAGGGEAGFPPEGSRKGQAVHSHQGGPFRRKDSQTTQLWVRPPKKLSENQTNTKLQKLHNLAHRLAKFQKWRLWSVGKAVVNK